mgnify:CR=1 FL=1
MMSWNIFITRDHLTSFKKIIKDSDKQMDSSLIIYISRLQKVLSNNVICYRKITSIPKYNLFKIKISSFLSMISKINKLLVSLSSTKLKLPSLMLRVNSILSIILMIFYNNKEILYNNSHRLSINLKNHPKNPQSREKAKNN